MTVMLLIALLIVAWGIPIPQMGRVTPGTVLAVYGSWAVAVIGLAFAAVVSAEGWP